jgi:hypothetical protein
LKEPTKFTRIGIFWFENIWQPCLRLGPGQLFDEGEELVVVAAVVVELDLTDELDLDALVLQTARLPVKGHVDLR